MQQYRNRYNMLRILKGFNMSGFTKLFSDIVMSTIWREDDKTRIVWITMLATADAEGNVSASVPGLADAARVSVEDCRRALSNLAAPDPDSRTKDFEGRRITEIEGGWHIINYIKYRNRNPSRAAYFRQYRENRKKTEIKTLHNAPQSTNVTQTDQLHPPATVALRNSTQAEAEAEAERGKSPHASLSQQIRADRSFGKCCIYCGASSKSDSGRMVWRERLPFCQLACYEKWQKQKKVR